MIKFVYFDLGGVVVLDLTANNGWAKMKKDLGITPEKDSKFEKFFDEIEREVNKGLDVESLVPIMKDKYEVRFPKNYSLLNDFVKRFKRNKPIWPIINKIKETCQVGLLTNMYPGMLNAIKNHKLLPKINWDVIIDSSIERIAKPDSELYKLAEIRAHAKGGEILFVDNSFENIKSAKLLGWHTFLYDPSNLEKSSAELLELFNKMSL